MHPAYRGRHESKPRVNVGLGVVSGSLCSAASRRTAVPVARNSVALTQTWILTSTVTPTMPEAPTCAAKRSWVSRRQALGLVAAQPRSGGE